jgi:branched-chain amino acid transport system permease protein
MLVLPEIADSNPSKKVATDYIEAYKKMYNAVPATFGANVYDAGLLLEKAIPGRQEGQAGSKEFAALRALEGTKEVVGTQGVYNMSPADHSGFDERGRELITVKGGNWTCSNLVRPVAGCAGWPPPWACAETLHTHPEPGAKVLRLDGARAARWLHKEVAMNLNIVALLGQDGITNGAIYALLALSIVLVFTVTRILLIPQGEFVSFGALTMGMMQNGQPLTVAWLLVALCLAACASTSTTCGAPAAAVPACGCRPSWSTPPWWPAWRCLNFSTLPMLAQIAMTLLLLVPMGPLMYRLAFQPIASASPLVLLIVSIAVHVALVGVALLVFGPDGAHGALHRGSWNWAACAQGAVGGVRVAAADRRPVRDVRAHALWQGLRAAAFNRMGARLMGISPVFAGKAMFLLASLIGVMSGVLIAPSPRSTMTRAS